MPGPRRSSAPRRGRAPSRRRRAGCPGRTRPGWSSSLRRPRGRPRSCSGAARR
ncbi:hypothetical protein BTZ20_3993 [Rhodococcus sp. MTM3W5.2]|nr:hypothetical protein BTZ20_3993 [Rhodococcus sp. MTM3W5.2]